MKNVLKVFIALAAFVLCCMFFAKLNSENVKIVVPTIIGGK